MHRGSIRIFLSYRGVSMLDLSKLSRQIYNMTFEFGQQLDELDCKLNEARKLFEEFDKDPHEWMNKIDSHDSHFFVAFPKEPISTAHKLPDLDTSYSILATDGSQIEIDTHEVALCYVINIGLVAIHYDGNTAPYLDSIPKLFYRDDDIYEYSGGEKTLISSTKLSEVRSSMEARNLCKLILEEKKDNMAAVGFVDGTLVSWDRAASAKKDIGAFTGPLFEDTFKAGERFATPIGGYISGSRTSLVVNTLRAKLCNRQFMDCSKCNRNAPCRQIDGLRDTILFKDILKKGERSTVFYGGINTLDRKDWPEYRIGFFYINTGEEIARIEAPDYVLENDGFLDLLHFAAYDQSQKGMGYPISLQEAHHLAVVRGPEREAFYRLVANTLIDAGLPSRVTNKKLRKFTRLF